MPFCHPQKSRSEKAVPVKIFFDLEFSDLQPDAMMVSAGFVAEDNEAFYVEVEEAFWRSGASQFVLDHVKPLLSNQGIPASEVASKIIDWLNSKGPEATLISDSDWDLRILQNHLQRTGYQWPDLWHWEMAPNHLPSKLHHAFDCAYQAWFLRSGHKQHHALNDAKALRDAHLGAITANE